MQPPAPLPSIGIIARQEFHRRRETALRKVNAGELRLQAAHDLLEPWLAIASAAGAYMPELYVSSEFIEPGQGWTKKSARLLPHDFCECAVWRRTLAEAAGAAIARADNALTPELLTRARCLVKLSAAFGLPAIIPAPRETLALPQAETAAPAEPAPQPAPIVTAEAATLQAPIPQPLTPQTMELPL